ncbi:MAG: DNA methyltransferase [Acidimicrobiia bacterium]
MTDSADKRRKPTATSNFGVGRRENHDASAFYDRFSPPELTDDDTVLAPTEIDEPFQKGDSRDMGAVADGSVALVVTSPPYFAGKQYEEELERDGIPASYVEYLELLTDVFADCKRTLEPGGRIAVNVANLGRKPYRSLSADVIRILQDDLGLLLRGEVVWRKGVGDVGAAGNCAWGSVRKPSNPVLRDVTERVVIASKGRFDRAQSVRERERAGFPSRTAVDADEFMAATLDVWDLPPESAKRVHHPAPFPVALPERLILLYTYENDLVLDPFMGSGSTLVAAAQHGRRYVGYDLDPEYVDLARSRLDDVAAAPVATDGGKAAAALAAELIEEAGFTITHRNRKLRGTGLTIPYIAADAGGRPWYFDVSGAFTTSRDGMLRTDTVWKSLGRAHVLAHNNPDGAPLVFLTSDLARPGSEGDVALRAAGPSAFFDAIALRDAHGFERLRAYADNGMSSGPVVGFWTERDLEP